MVSGCAGVVIDEVAGQHAVDQDGKFAAVAVMALALPKRTAGQR